MKKELHPGAVAAIIAVVVVVAAVFLYRASVAKPMYPGFNVPAGGPRMGELKTKENMTPDDAKKAGIPGAGMPGNAPASDANKTSGQ